jgi:hypothetical protein
MFGVSIHSEFSSSGIDNGKLALPNWSVKNNSIGDGHTGIGTGSSPDAMSNKRGLGDLCAIEEPGELV